MRNETILGALADWPLAQRIAKLVALPAEAYRVPVYQAVGTKAHCAKVETLVFRRAEPLPPALEGAANDTFLGLLEACASLCGGSIEERDTSFGFHGSATPAQVRADLAKSFDVLTPVEALAARTLTPGAALDRIATRLTDASMLERRAVRAFLEGGPFIDALLGIDAFVLSRAVVSDFECLDAVSRRLLFLWTRVAQTSSSSPTPPAMPELGFDRFGACVQELTAMGVHGDAALDYTLVHQALASRWWPSTGVYVWERLAEDAPGFIERVRSVPRGDDKLASVLMSFAWLPSGLLAAGGGELLRKVCSMPSLVPDRAFAQLVEDDQAREALKPVQRSKRPPKAMTLVVKRVARQQDRLVPREDEAATRSRLEALGPSAAGAVRAAVPTKPLTKTAAKATAAKRAAASAVRTRKVTSVLRELSRLASGRRAVQATPAQLASLTRLAGTLPAELAAYFSFAANPDDAFSTSADVEPLLSLAGAMRTMKALRRYEFPETLVPLLDYQDGNFACFDVETSQMMFWDHETRGTSKLAPDLGTALERLRLRPSRAASKKARVGPGAAGSKRRRSTS